ncbi:hypothetical protein GLAREA_06879 [Glarea lozoyensis ATCC 20868]|uniref:C2H2-type domain-containing protein n=1 Tax=Glarea lozoyensis (strain ATCC 20868 / MF5171) TaxID=1116229 RepID=S3DP54_GLAL2|nr:uncharacterized protein GLAREA_06879 [Glarea lozoyensis ATCC 20868]EPE33866.1 hypothetical protein GLAREA_06879 [Glarea lozoyensis ATCC 20868]
MARGLQKIEAQAKANAAKNKGGHSTLKSDKGMKYQCVTCKQEIDSLSNMKTHWTSKHPKLDTPTDEFASMSKAPAVAEASGSAKNAKNGKGGK